jgi:Translation initiation factor eIF3 subunit
MSDSDDWEKIAEKDDAALEEILKTKKFGDEISVPVVEEVKQTAPPPVPKPKIGEKLSNKNKKKTENTEEVKETPDQKTKRIAEGKIQEVIADNEITEDLFNVKPVTVLITDDNYIEYAREVNRSLSKGQHHFRLPVFFKELLKDTSSLMTADDIYKVITQLNIIHTEKLKAEKGPGKKTNSKPTLKGETKKTKIGYDEDDQGDEFDDYGDFL